MKRTRAAVRAFREALHREPTQKSTEGRPAADHPASAGAPSWLDKGELPESYARTKVVAMVVSPYMVHVYWDLGEKDRAGNEPATLRFHGGGGESFDVKVDLPARNWYIHLWSPEQRYYVELGVERGGEFAALARSNTIETPRAWPVAEISERFARVEPVPPPELRAEPKPVTAAPAPMNPVQPEQSTLAAKQDAHGSNPPVREVAVQAPLAPPPPVAQSPDNRLEPDLPSNPPRAPERVSPETGISRFSASETLRTRLLEFYSFRHRMPRPVVSVDPSAEEPSVPVAIDAGGEPVMSDLTGRTESRFAPGLSSVLLGLSSSKKPVA